MSEFSKKYDMAMSVNTDFYSLESVQLAACAYLDDAYFYLSGEDGAARPSRVKVSIGKRAESQLSGDEILAGFLGELNRQSLRLMMTKSNRKVRAQIVGRALVSSTPVEEDEDAKKAD